MFTQGCICSADKAGSVIIRSTAGYVTYFKVEFMKDGELVTYETGINKKEKQFN